MNTFITLARDLECHSLKDVMELVVALEKAAQAVQDVWCDSLSIHNTKTQKRTLQNLFELRELIIEKLDFATVHLLRFVDQQLNDRAELNVEETATDVTIGMWASFNDIRPIRKSVQFEKLGAQIDLPKQILQQDARFVFRMVRMPITVSNFEAYSGISPDLPIEEVELYQKLHAKYIVGDMFSFDILLAPPPALTIRAKKWTMRDKSSAATTIRKSPYPSSVASRMFLKVPDTVVMSDDLRVARWDEEHREWTEDGITDFQYSEANRMVQFYITTTGTFALIKSRTIDMPYKRWAITTTSVKIAPEMSPNGELIAKKDPFFEQRAQMAINTQRHEILIDITGADCILVKPDNTNFNDLVGKRFSPGALFWRLQRRGVNLLPTSFDETSMEAYGPKV